MSANPQNLFYSFFFFFFQKVADQDVAPPSSLEIQLSQIDVIRSRYHRDRLLRLIHEKITLFDSELRLLRQHKTKLDVNLKMADLR